MMTLQPIIASPVFIEKLAALLKIYFSAFNLLNSKQTLTKLIRWHHLKVKGSCSAWGKISVLNSNSGKPSVQLLSLLAGWSRDKKAAHSELWTKSELLNHKYSLRWNLHCYMYTGKIHMSLLCRDTFFCLHFTWAVVKGMRKLLILNVIRNIKTVSFLLTSNSLPSLSSTFLNKADTECV